MSNQKEQSKGVPEQVFSLRQKGYSFNQIGNILGFTRQRAQQAYDQYLLNLFKAFLASLNFSVKKGAQK